MRSTAALRRPYRGLRPTRCKLSAPVAWCGARVRALAVVSSTCLGQEEEGEEQTGGAMPDTAAATGQAASKTKEGAAVSGLRPRMVLAMCRCSAAAAAACGARQLGGVERKLLEVAVASACGACHVLSLASLVRLLKTGAQRGHAASMVAGFVVLWYSVAGCVARALRARQLQAPARLPSAQPRCRRLPLGRPLVAWPGWRRIIWRPSVLSSPPWSGWMSVALCW